MSQRKGDNSEVLSVRLPKATAIKLAELAAATNSSKSEVVRLLIRRATIQREMREVETVGISDSPTMKIVD